MKRAVRSTPPTYHPAPCAWNLTQTMDIRMTKDERDLILGLNAARVFGIGTSPRHKRTRAAQYAGLVIPVKAAVGL